MSEPTARGVDREGAIIDAFVHLSDTLVEDYDVIEFLHFLTERCVELTGIDEAGVMIGALPGHLQAVAASTERSYLLELFELQNQDGPCLDAFRGGVTVTAADLAEEPERWPIFTPRAVSAGFSSVHSIPMRLRNEVIGAVNLLSVGTGVMSQQDARLARALSDIATVAILQQRTISDVETINSRLSTALNSRIRIEQAKGVLAERAGTTVDEAFAMIRSYARSRQRSLTGVCDDIVRRVLDVGDVVESAP
jgi:transcriptional regulator with GAF, ATPase, and Fis domain